MIEFIDNSWEKVSKDEFPDIYYEKDWWKDVHDHSRLPGIFQRLYFFFPEDSPIVKIFKLILFHQSIQAVKEFPNTRILTDDEIKEYMSVEELYLIKIILNNDTFSYG